MLNVPGVTRPPNSTPPREELSLLKTDTRGHVRVSKARRAAILVEFDRSAMSAAGFARLHGIKYTTFKYWQRVRREAAIAANPPTLVEVTTSAASSTNSSLQVGLPGGANLIITDEASAKLAALLLRELSVQAPC